MIISLGLSKEIGERINLVKKEIREKPVYILSLEANDIYNHMHRDSYINYDYVGMIPHSLELIKLRNSGLNVKYLKNREKDISDDIINVKFKQKVKSAKELSNIVYKKKINNENNPESLGRLNDFLVTIEENNESWNSISASDLRKILYTEGFKITRTNEKTGKTKATEYVAYKRSSSKSRTGQCLFIKKELYNKMIKWSRLNLPIRKGMNIDLAGLLAYESLVGSSIESTMTLNPDKILLIEDVDSEFEQVCNVVKKGKDGFLDSFKEKTTVSNSLFDGQSLLDSKHFEDGTSMKLLRNHMFKSAAFNCNIQEFFKNNCPKEINYDDWQITDKFGNKLFAKDIELITTPNSVKVFKFTHVLKTKNDSDMWNYWRSKVKEDGSLFGVCKNEKESKIGRDLDKRLLQQTSYQMVNCLPIKQKDIKKLVETEYEYIDRLKNDDLFFIQKLRESATIINNNKVYVDLYEHNKDFIRTNNFKKVRRQFIYSQRSHAKKGKIKLNGDYCVMLGNPLEFLKHAIGKFDISENKHTLKNNEVYTNLFDFDKEYVGFRNPNTSPSNVLVVKNKQVKEIEKYFNLTPNIVCVNAINFALQDILSGADYDSDTVLLFDNDKLLALAKECFGNYKVCINHIEGQKKKYKLTTKDMYDIDNQLSNSQTDIGKVVNLGQLCMSYYWDLKNNLCVDEHKVENLLKKVDVMTILSGIAIDMAKKFYEIDITKEIKNVESIPSIKERKKKPLFWRYVSQSKTIERNIKMCDCPMDYLIKNLEENIHSTRESSILIDSLLLEKPRQRANEKQFDNIMKRISLLDRETQSLYAKKYSNKKERDRLIDSTFREHLNYIKSLKIKEDTMFRLVKHLIAIEHGLLFRVLSVLNETHPKSLLEIFKKGEILS